MLKTCACTGDEAETATATATIVSRVTRMRRSFPHYAGGLGPTEGSRTAQAPRGVVSPSPNQRTLHQWEERQRASHRSALAACWTSQSVGEVTCLTVPSWNQLL